MLTESRTTLHLGVNFVFVPQPVLDAVHLLDFQQRLVRDDGIRFTTTTSLGQGAHHLLRDQPPLEVQLQHPGPPVGQLLILASRPARILDDFLAEAEAVCAAFRAVWPGPIQVVQRDCTVRHLYDVAAGDAWEYLWERRLHADRDELAVFGRRVQGGGLRLVLPAGEPDESTPQVEVKIESFLQDPKKLFVDVAMTWPNPGVQPSELDPGVMLKETEDFATNQVVGFIRGVWP